MLSEKYQWTGLPLDFNVDGSVKVRFPDVSQSEGYKDMILTFKHFYETKGVNGMCPMNLYRELFPELMVGKKLNLEALLDFFPGTELTFKIEPEDIYVKESEDINNKEFPAYKPFIPIYEQPEREKLKAELRIELKNELRAEILLELKKEKPDPNHKIIQKTISGDFIRSFKNAKDAEYETKIPAQNIYNMINGKRKTAGGFLWEKSL